MASQHGHSFAEGTDPLSSQSCDDKPNFASFVSDLLFEELPVRETVAAVKRYMEKLSQGIDDSRDSYGQTALMAACCNGNFSLVRLLLKAGANPNLTDKNGDSALHSVCYYSPSSRLRMVRRGEKRKKLPDEDEQTLAILKLLLKNNAVVTKNKHGSTPAEIAAYWKKQKSVTYLVDNGDMEAVDIIRALEILGVKLGIDGHHENAYVALHRAKKMRIDEDIPCDVKVNKKIELESFFGHPESRNLEELEKLKDDLEGMRAEAFLISERIFPEGKKELFEDDFAELGNLKLAYPDLWSEAFHIFLGCIQLEKKGLMELGHVLYLLSEAIDDMVKYANKNSKKASELRDHVLGIFNAYTDAFQEVDHTTLENVGLDTGGLAYILFVITSNFFSFQFLDAVVGKVYDILNIVWGRIHKPVHEKFELRILNRGSYSVCHSIINFLVEKSKVKGPKRFTRLIAQLLLFEDARDVNSHGCSMLDTLLTLNYCWRYPFVVDIVRLLFKHGCSRERKNDRVLYRTAFKGRSQVDSDLECTGLFALREEDKPRVKVVGYALCDLLEQPEDIASLELLAMRAVCRNRIPYRKFLPRSLWHLVEDSILKEPESAFR